MGDFKQLSIFMANEIKIGNVYSNMKYTLFQNTFFAHFVGLQVYLLQTEALGNQLNYVGNTTLKT